MSIETSNGRDFKIVFEGARCVHSRNCVLDRPDMFEPNANGEWLHADAGGVEDAMRIAKNCPSGAIRCERSDGGEDESAPLVNTVSVREDGPLAFNAPLSIDGERDQLRATLCRCGASKRKPWCDGSHTEIGFRASGERAAVESKPGAAKSPAARDGPVDVQPQKDGPLKVSGPLEIVSGSGHTIDRVSETFLCRCGHSQNKPFCDGTHRRAGFRAG